MPFAPCVVQFAKRILVPSAAAVAKLADDLLEEHATPGLRQETLEAMHKTLATGEGLESTVQEAVTSVNCILSPMKSGMDAEKVDLFS